LAVTALKPGPLALVKKPAIASVPEALPRSAVPLPFCWTYRAVPVELVVSVVLLAPALLVAPWMTASPAAAQASPARPRPPASSPATPLSAPTSSERRGPRRFVGGRWMQLSHGRDLPIHGASSRAMTAGR